MSIRNAKFEDLSKIVEIYNDSIPDRKATADIYPIDVADRISWFNTHNNTNRPLWVIEDHNTVVGWLSLHDFHVRCAYNKTVEISIYISKFHREKGLARKLLGHCMDTIPRLNIKVITALVFAHNTPSLELFKKFGFIEWGYLPKVAELDQQEKDLVILGYTQA